MMNITAAYGFLEMGTAIASYFWLRYVFSRTGYGVGNCNFACTGRCWVAFNMARDAHTTGFEG